MASLTEVAEYIESVLRLDLETPVKGFDGTELGPSNEQAQALANRTKWLKEQLELLSGSVDSIDKRDYVVSVNKKTGALLLSYSDVGAAKAQHTHKPADIETSDEAKFVSSKEKETWDNKQDKLSSGENIKTLLGFSLVGSGDVTLTTDNIESTATNRYTSDKEKEVWNAKQSKLVSGTDIATLHGKTLLQSGDIKLTHSDVGADKSGAAESAVSAHVAEEDPHTQYLTLERAGESFVLTNKGNKPNGYLQLDKNGYIPADLAELFQARYIIANNLSERLGITVGGDITICLQTDNNLVYYLNAFEDASDENNWKQGRTTDVNAIFSVFGRTGAVVGQADDYNADQITETETRLFLSPSNKNKWDGKQDKLVSGTSIKTINGVTLLDKGDIEITPESIGAADKDHTHKASEITTDEKQQFVSAEEKEKWNGAQPELVSGTNIKTLNSNPLLGSGNIELTYSDVGAAAEEHTHKPSEIKTDDDNQFVTVAEKKTWNAKQSELESGVSIKRVMGEDVLGEGNIEITASDIGAAAKEHTHKPSEIKTDEDNQFVTLAQKQSWNDKQDKLVSGENIATVFGKSLLRGNDIGLSSIEDFGKNVYDVLKPGDGVSIELDEEADIVTIGFNTEATSINENTVDDAKTDERYIYPGERNNFDFVAYALEKVIASEAHTSELSYDDYQGVIATSDAPAFDSTGYIPNADGAKKYPMSAVSSNYETYITGEIPAPKSGTLSVGIDLGGNGKEIVPTLTSADNGEVSIVSNTEEEGYEAWKLFNNRKTTGLLADKQYWRAAYVWSDRPSLPIITIKFKQPITADSFGIQTYSGFESTGGKQSTIPSKLALQCRLSDAHSWEQVTTGYFTIPSLLDTSKVWVVAKMRKQYTFAQFQIIVREVSSTSRVPALTGFQFFNGIGGLIKSAAGDYYTVADDTLSKVTPSSSMFDQSSFGGTEKPLPLSEINDLFPIKICSNGISEVNVTGYTDSQQIAINFPIDKTLPWTVLSDFEVATTYKESDMDTMRVAVTADGKEHFVLKDGSWKSLDILTTSSVSAKVLAEQGMAISDFAAITAEQWKPFLTKVDTNYGVGLSYASTITNSSDKLTPKTLKFEFGDYLYWRKMSESEIEIRLEDDKISFKPSADGSYKFCYKFM